MNRWDQRYDTDEFIYGTEPNGFLAEVTDQLPVGRTLCIAQLSRLWPRRVCSYWRPILRRNSSIGQGGRQRSICLLQPKTCARSWKGWSSCVSKRRFETSLRGSCIRGVVR